MSLRYGSLQGKIAVVTGGGSGFGAEIGKKLAQEGAAVTLLDVDDAGGARVAVCRDPDGNFVTLMSGPKLPGSRVAAAKAPKRSKGRSAPKAKARPKAKAKTKPKKKKR